MQEAGLTGRGGAGFPTARKLAAVAAGGRAVVVANGAEGEPASSKDRVLLLRPRTWCSTVWRSPPGPPVRPSAYLYAPADLVDRLLAIARQRRDPVPVTRSGAPDTFIAGQETAVVAAVEGRRRSPGACRRALPGGVRGRPTLVQNVETLAHLGLIARYGPAWFRSIGTADEPGTRLLTVSGAVSAPACTRPPPATRSARRCGSRRRHRRAGAGRAGRRLPRRLGAVAADTAGCR